MVAGYQVESCWLSKSWYTEAEKMDIMCRVLNLCLLSCNLLNLVRAQNMPIKLTSHLLMGEGITSIRDRVPVTHYLGVGAETKVWFITKYFIHF